MDIYIAKALHTRQVVQPDLINWKTNDRISKVMEQITVKINAELITTKREPKSKRGKNSNKSRIPPRENKKFGEGKFTTAA